MGGLAKLRAKVLVPFESKHTCRQGKRTLKRAKNFVEEMNLRFICLKTHKMFN